MRAAWWWGVGLALGVVSSAAAQVSAVGGATARVPDPVQGLGAGAEWRARVTPTLAIGFAAWTAFDRLGDPGIDYEGGGKVSARAGAGRWQVEGGGFGLRSKAGSTVDGVGGFVATNVRLGHLTIAGELGQLVTISGSLLSLPVPGTDTLFVKSNSPRQFRHAALRAEWRHRGVGGFGRLLARSGADPKDAVGWELGVLAEPFGATRFRLSVARAPIGASLFLPLRNRVTLGVELVPRRVSRAPALDSVATLRLFEAAVDAPGRITFRVRRPGAERVELLGDFSNWDPIALVRVGDRWEASVPIGAGVWLINLRFDGGALEVPDGLAAAADGFGGQAGVLVVR